MARDQAKRGRWLRRGAWGLAALAALPPVALLAALSLGLPAGELTQTLRARWGPAVPLADRLRLTWQPGPRLVVTRPRVPAPGWAQAEHLARAEALVLELEPRRLLAGGPPVGRVWIRGLAVALERRNGLASWRLGGSAAGSGGPTLPLTGPLHMDDARLTWRGDAGAPLQIRATSLRLSAPAPGPDPLPLGGRLRVRGASVEGAGAPVSGLSGEAAAVGGGIRLSQLRGEVAGVPLRAAGTLTRAAGVWHASAVLWTEPLELSGHPPGLPGRGAARLAAGASLESGSLADPRRILEALRIEGLTLRYREAAADTRLAAGLRQALPTGSLLAGGAPWPEGGPVLTGAGRLRGEPVRLQLAAAPPAHLLTDPDAPLGGALAAGNARIAAAATRRALTAPAELQLALRARGGDPRPLGALLDLSLPPVPSFRLEARLGRDGDRWRLHRIDGQAGGTAVAGRLDLDLGARPLGLDLRLRLGRLSLDPWLHGNGTAGVMTPARLEAALQGYRLHARIQAAAVTAGAGPRLEEVTLEARVGEGRVRLEGLDAALSGGRLHASGALDARSRPASGHLEARLEGVRVDDLTSPFALTAADPARVSGRVRVASLPGAGAEAPGDALLGPLALRAGRLTVVNEATGTDLELRLEATGEPPQQRLAVRGTGRYRDAPFALVLTGGRLEALRRPGASFPLQLRVEAADSRLRVRGTVTDPLAPRRLDLRARLTGPNPQRLYPLLGVALPDLPPYALRGRLRLEAGTWVLEDFEGTVGDSDLSGTLRLDTGGALPHLSGDLRSRRLDLDDLAGLVGAAPAVGPGEAAAPKQRREARREARDMDVLPEDRIATGRLADLSADVHWRAQAVAARLPLEGVRMDVAVSDGRLRLDPLAFQVAGGRISGSLTLDPTPDPPRGALDLQVRGLGLSRALAGLGLAAGSEGEITGAASLDFRGTSTASLLGSAEGDAHLLMTGGKLNALLVELAGLDLGEALVASGGGREPVAIECAYLGLEARAGRLRVRHGILETTDTLFTARGSLDLGTERLDLSLEPRPEDPSLLAAASPVHVHGRLARPEISLGAEAAVRGTAAAALGAVAGPLAALLPLLETGSTPADPDRCRRLLGAARSDAGGSPAWRQDSGSGENSNRSNR